MSKGVNRVMIIFIEKLKKIPDAEKKDLLDFAKLGAIAGVVAGIILSYAYLTQ